MSIRFNQKITSKLFVDYWITSDLHFYHKGVLSFCEGTRPWKGLDEMHEALITEWNSKVKPDDVIIHLGDFSFKGRQATEEIISRLNGNIVWVLGNHDKSLRDQIRPDNTFDYLEFRYGGVKVLAAHYPMTCWNQQGRGSVMLHGHTHGSYQGKGRIVDVGYDNWGKIIPLQEAIDFCLGRDIYCPDHHKVVM